MDYKKVSMLQISEYLQSNMVCEQKFNWGGIIVSCTQNEWTGSRHVWICVLLKIGSNRRYIHHGRGHQQQTCQGEYHYMPATETIVTTQFNCRLTISQFYKQALITEIYNISVFINVN